MLYAQVWNEVKRQCDDDPAAVAADDHSDIGFQTEKEVVSVGSRRYSGTTMAFQSTKQSPTGSFRVHAKLDKS